MKTVRIHRGYIALMSAVVISAVLLVITTTSSLTGFNARMNALNFEYKEQSRQLALACIDQAILSLSVQSTYAGDATSTLDENANCHISAITVSNSPPEAHFKTSSNYKNAVTTFEVVVRLTDFKVLSRLQTSAW